MRGLNPAWLIGQSESHLCSASDAERLGAYVHRDVVEPFQSLHDDARAAGFEGPRAGLQLQRAIERRGFEAGGGALRAPATRLTDFLAGRSSADVPDSSYVPGLTAGNLADVLDSTGLPIAARLREGLTAFGSKMRGFVSQEAVLVGVESRTSCPVRIPRDPTLLESPDVTGLYPCGEGAGYAGGIVSAALDGIRVARAIARAWDA